MGSTQEEWIENIRGRLREHDWFFGLSEEGSARWHEGCKQLNYLDITSRGDSVLSEMVRVCMHWRDSILTGKATPRPKLLEGCNIRTPLTLV